MIFRTTTHIAHRQIEFGSGNSGMRDTGSRGAHQYFSFGVFLANSFSQSTLDIFANIYIAQRQSVVAINRALDSTCPRKRLLRTKEHRLDLKQITCYFFFYHILSGSAHINNLKPKLLWEHSLPNYSNSLTHLRYAATGSSAAVMGRPTTI